MSVVGWLSDMIADGAQVHVADEGWGWVDITLTISRDQLDAARTLASAKQLAASSPQSAVEVSGAGVPARGEP